MSVPAAIYVKFKLFSRRQHPLGSRVELTQRIISIQPTRKCMGFASIMSLMLLTAFIYNNNLLYLLAFLLLSLILISILHAYKALASLRVDIGVAQPAFAGDTVLWPLMVENLSGQPRPTLCAILAERLEFELAARRRISVILPMFARKRGRQVIDAVTLEGSDPLGIFCARSRLRFDRHALVYPKPAADAAPLPLSGGQSSTGQQSSELKGDDDFAGIRAYRRGDALSKIHWRAYAKGQGLFSKTFSAEAGVKEVWIDFERAGAGHAEARLGLMCRWVLDAEKAGLRYGLSLPGRRLAPDRGSKHQANCLEALALY